MIRAAFLALVLVSPAAALAETAPRPYAGLETRTLKALSDDEIADLRAGRGMGLALAAELNGYPGPAHVLEHAAALGLTADQRARTEALHAAMTAEAVRLGEQLIREEAALDRLFATRTVEPASLEAATGAIGAAEGELRAAHLGYHLAMMEVLSPEQVRRYAELRGYAGHVAGGHRHGGQGAEGHRRGGQGADGHRHGGHGHGTGGD